ncbi:ATP-binding cassette domain-containing protein [Magnetospirillum sulfuroxidans]|uniref:ABC transporter ATP-binding protein n=1 Tax=Magnetospirillum sulfuroxidans TaxID=611300 RepID=A0ABS5I766_9PROT|nr:ATP-binding cassette domain-containing protein [Magnetospirillum sulfuroxidans]MBR9970267.1 ABC transporter ATP-binding protein [Magnetospirillum sulfuroxidans]
MTTAITLSGVGKRFGPTIAVDNISAALSAGRVTGLVGADGAGKTTLMRLMAGLLNPDDGSISVNGDIGYMPQRFGLYEDLTVSENLRLYAELRSLAPAEQPAIFARLLDFSGLDGFQTRLAGKLSGGMKQKLGLACALVATPSLLLLDEPSVGVDPVSRRQLWRMVHELAEQGVGVVWSTAYLDEAERCHEVLLLDQGRLLHVGPPAELTKRVEGRCFVIKGGADRRKVQLETSARPDVRDSLIQGASVRLVMEEGAPPPKVEGHEVSAVPPRFEDAFITLLERKAAIPTLPPRHRPAVPTDGIAVRATDLVRRFDDFVAVDQVSFAVKAGEIFGLLGPNGAGKSTTFRMLCGLLPVSSGIAEVGGRDLAHAAAQGRQNLGYMSQKFSLYPDLSVQQNLNFFSGIYGLAGKTQRQTIATMRDVFALDPYGGTNAGALPLGFKQRLALACAIMHGPDTLFLDEPTSGVDPLVRREFWTHINAMAAEGVSVLVTTHFLDEAEYCDRLGIIFAGKLIALGTPDEIKAQARSDAIPDPTLEDAFVALVEKAQTS